MPEINTTDPALQLLFLGTSLTSPRKATELGNASNFNGKNSNPDASITAVIDMILRRQQQVCWRIRPTGGLQSTLQRV